MNTKRLPHSNGVNRAWQAVRQYFVPHFSMRDWSIILLMALWLYLNIFDLLITYQGLASGKAYEANRFFSYIIHIPVLAVTVKMSLVFILLKVIQRVEQRTPYSGLVPLLAANIFLCWVCLHNLFILDGLKDGADFLRYFPLVGR